MNKVTSVPLVPRRRPDANKGDFGHVLVLGGALGMSGSVALAGRAALRSGAGLVTLGCPARSQPIVAGLVPEALTIPLPERLDGRIDPGAALRYFLAHPGRWTVLAAGCGWGAADETFAADSGLLMDQMSQKIGGPTVIDADGLNLLAATGRLERESWANLVITPHPGELARLLHTTPGEIQADRLAAAAEAAKNLHTSVLVLKGAGTLVTDGDRYYVNTTGNPGMATGGTGDVLTGILAALAAPGQGLDPFDAAVLAVYVHGLAGDLAAGVKGEISLVAADLVDFLPAAFCNVQRSGLARRSRSRRAAKLDNGPRSGRKPLREKRRR